MIDLSQEVHPRFHLHSLSGSVLMTDDPAKTANPTAESMRKAVSGFQARQSSFQFNNTSYQYEHGVAGMGEASRSLLSNFDFDALSVYVSDPLQSRRKAALDVMQDGLSPSAPGLVPQVAPRV